MPINRVRMGLMMLLCFAAASSTAAPTPAEEVLLNGRIYTPKGWQQALAVRGGKILAVGPAEKIAALVGPGTRTVDLAGAVVFPGLGDMHVHPLWAGTDLNQCRFAQGSTPDQILAAVGACAKQKKPGEWIVGGQWEASSFHGKPPGKEMLDQVSPDNPVVLSDISLHSVWVNSKLLAEAKITRETADPAGGIIERDAQGNPTGVFRENAAALVRDLIPKPSPAEDVTALKQALDILLSHGVTMLTDARVKEDSLIAYDSLADRGALKQHVRGCLTYGFNGVGADFERLLAARASYARPRYQTDCVKIFMDGVPTESHTAAMLEPYAMSDSGHGEAAVRGMLMLQPAELDPLVARLDKMGLTLKFHSAGDGSVRAAMDAVAAARASNGPGGPSHDVAHLTFVNKADLARAKSIGATLEYSPYLWFPSPINDDIIKAVGAERIERVWPVREGIASGALVIAGSDWPVVPSANPWIGIETLVTRKAPDNQRPGEVYGPAEAITLKQAIDLFTINAANHMGLGKSLGSIAVGKNADLIVLDRDPFSIPATDIHAVTVTRTFIDGKEVKP